jgi:hypothetical protein
VRDLLKLCTFFNRQEKYRMAKAIESNETLYWPAFDHFIRNIGHCTRYRKYTGTCTSIICFIFSKPPLLAQALFAAFLYCLSIRETKHALIPR